VSDELLVAMSYQLQAMGWHLWCLAMG